MVVFVLDPTGVADTNMVRKRFNCPEVQYLQTRKFQKVYSSNSEMSIYMTVCPLEYRMSMSDADSRRE